MQDLLELIKTVDNSGLTEQLKENPSLATAPTGHGISLLQFAAYCWNAGAIGIIRQYHKELNLFEAVSLGEREW